MVTWWKEVKCPVCERIIVIGQKKGEPHLIMAYRRFYDLKTDKYKITEKVESILKSSQDAYAKKIALFNFVKNLEVEGMEPSEERRVNCLLEGKLYNEIAKEKMKEYKRLTAEDFNKT